MLAERGIDVSYQTVRCWMKQFGPAIAANIREARGRAKDIWHLGGMVVRIGGMRPYMRQSVALAIRRLRVGFTDVALALGAEKVSVEDKPYSKFKSI